MNSRIRSIIVAISVVTLITACGTVNKDVNSSIDRGQIKSKEAFREPVRLSQVSRVVEVSGKRIPVTAVTNIRTNDWLKKIQVELKIDNPTPMSAVIEKLSAQGLNIVSDLPLNSYTYTGRITKTDADAALKAILGSVGLDFQADDARKLVMIKPMASRSWFLNIGNRHSSYSSDGSTSTPSSGSSGASTSSAGAGTSGSTGTPGSGSGTSSGPTSGSTGQNISSTQSSGSGTGVASADDFWTSLSNELKTRLSVLMPRGGSSQSQPGLPSMPGIGSSWGSPMQVPGLSNMQQQMPMPGQPDSGIYVSRNIGTYSLNPETGAITVQAPHWILDDLDVYIKRVQEMYNTDITFSGELVLVTSNRTDSEGFDLSAFATWAGGKYAAVISNNALGGITLSLPGAGVVPSVAAGAQAVAGPLMGMQYQTGRNTMKIFNDYLSENGKVSVIQRPLITTTSGVPGVFSKKFTDYYNTVSQQAAAGGTGSAATATQNTLVPVELGTELRINPRIDISTGLIRAQLTLNQSIQSGTKNVSQTITFGNNTTTINTPIPLVTRQNLSGEILLRDGDLIVVGGQTEDNLSTDESGLPGSDGPLGGVLGVKKATKGSQTYYFALRVSVAKRK